MAQALTLRRFTVPNTIAELNDWSNQALTYTDDRPYSITFSANAASNQSVSIVEDQSFIVPSGIDIVSATSLPGNITYTINTANVGNAILSWPALPQGVSSAEPSTGVYQITGVFDGVTWSELKQAVIVFKDRTANATFTSNIAYPNTANVALSNTWSWTTNVAVTASSDELSTPTGFSFDEDTPLVIPGPPLITDAYSGNLPYSITVTPNTTDAVLTMVSTGLANSSFNLGPRQLTITGTKLEVNNNLGNITLTPGVDWDQNFSLTYSLTNPVSNLVTQVTQAANIGNVDTDFSFTSSYDYSEDGQVQLVFSVGDNDPTITELKMAVTQTLGNTGVMFVNGVNAGVGNTAILSVANETAFNTANVTYVARPDDNGAVQLTANVYKTNSTGNVTVATNQVMTLTCTSTHGDFQFGPDGTYNRNRFEPYTITDTDTRTTSYIVSIQQTTGNIGSWYVNGNLVSAANSVLNLSNSRANINSANINWIPAVNDTGNAGITVNQSKINTLFGNITQASNVVVSLTGNADPFVNNMISRAYTANTVNQIFANTTPFIDESDVGQTYTIQLDSSLGRFGNTAADTLSSNTYSATGNLTAINNLFGNIVFVPNYGSTGANGTFAYTQSRSNVQQFTSNVALTGTASSYAGNTYIIDASTSSFSAAPTDLAFGNITAFITGGGGAASPFFAQIITPPTYTRAGSGGAGANVAYITPFNRSTVANISTPWNITIGAGGSGFSNTDPGFIQANSGATTTVVTGFGTWTAEGGEGGTTPKNSTSDSVGGNPSYYKELNAAGNITFTSVAYAGGTRAFPNGAGGSGAGGDGNGSIAGVGHNTDIAGGAELRYAAGGPGTGNTHPGNSVSYGRGGRVSTGQFDGGSGVVIVKFT
jgi:hypothetical protein